MIRDVGDAGRARFLAGLGAARRQQLDGWPGWEGRLAFALEEPSRVWNGEWFSREDFSGELALRLDSDDEDLDSWWKHLRPADLYLACACARGVAAAIARFEQLYGEEIARSARRFERPGMPAEDLHQLLREKLFAGAPSSGSEATTLKSEDRPKIASYTGQGFLQNWLRVTATRTFIDCSRVRGEASGVAAAEDLIAALPEPGADPELQLLKREHAAHFKAAFAEAVTALDGADRLLLKQQLVEGLTIDQIGAVYHLHRATAARRLAKAREALLENVRAVLGRRLGLSSEQLAGILELVASRLEVSVERLLR